MLTSEEKFQAITEEFPNIPFQSLADVADEVRLYEDLRRIYSIVKSYIRHTMTPYESMLKALQAPGHAKCSGLSYGNVRYEVEPLTKKILHSWK